MWHMRLKFDWSSDVCSSDLSRIFSGDAALILNALKSSLWSSDDSYTGSTFNESAFNSLTSTLKVAGIFGSLIRSEERRVGKERRSRKAGEVGHKSDGIDISI